jgi:hypothetical protein
MRFLSPRASLSSAPMLRVDRLIRCGLQMAGVIGLAVSLTGCPKSPSIAATITSNSCFGGVLNVSGSGFTKNGKVQISAANTPGSPTLEKIFSGTADKNGNINFNIQYWSPEINAGKLPGCNPNSGATVPVTILAVDEASGSLTPVTLLSTVNLRNCAIAWGQECPQ